jgi:hypothetical protein
MALVVMVLTLSGSAPAQTPAPTPTPSATPPQVDRLKVAVQLEREQNDPVLMTVIFAAQYATAADNSRSTRIRYDVLISLSSVGALPWYRLSFSTTLGL